jgi:hypothetical protein
MQPREARGRIECPSGSLMDWTIENDQDMRDKGYTVLPQRVSAPLIELAAGLIVRDFLTSEPRTLAEWEFCGNKTFCKDLIESDSLRFLVMESGAFAFGCQGIGSLDQSDFSIQVARRRFGDEGTPHIDGFYYSAGDDSPADTPDAVLGIYLTDVLRISDGPFEVWPEARALVRDWAKGMTVTPRRSCYPPFLANLASGQPVLGPRGTAFIAHGALPHRNARRTAQQDYRDAVFFRLYRSADTRNVLKILQSGGDRWY